MVKFNKDAHSMLNETRKFKRDNVLLPELQRIFMTSPKLKALNNILPTINKKEKTLNHDRFYVRRNCPQEDRFRIFFIQSRYLILQLSSTLIYRDSFNTQETCTTDAWRNFASIKNFNEARISGKERFVESRRDVSDSQ